MLAAGASIPPPKQIWLCPPGGACTRVVGRSVMPLPQFWSDPFANALDDWPRLLEGAKQETGRRIRSQKMRKADRTGGEGFSDFLTITRDARQ